MSLNAGETLMTKEQFEQWPQELAGDEICCL